CIEFD
ncbi:natural resistance-associated macrophage family protein, partial [Vibrio parahaemolyticus AQ3810]